MTTTQFYGESQLATALGVVGGNVLGTLRNDLLKQAIVAAANRSGGGGGSGDVIGPASSVTGHVAIFADTTGKLLADGGAGAFLATSNIFTVASASSTPAMSFTGAIFTGGSAATTKPHILIEPAGVTAGSWNTSGTAVGLNMPSGFSGDVLAHQRNGVPQFSVTSLGKLKWGDIGSFGIRPVLYLEGPYATAEWWQSGDGGIATRAPFASGTTFKVEDPSNQSLYTQVSWNSVNTIYSSSNGQFAYGAAALATTATDGYFCLRSCDGAPTGIPANIPTGAMPIVYDSTNNKIYIYNGGWKSTSALV